MQIRDIADFKAVVLLLSESHAIINDLDVILHGFMLQIISTTVSQVKAVKQSHPSRSIQHNHQEKYVLIMEECFRKFH